MEHKDTDDRHKPTVIEDKGFFTAAAVMRLMKPHRHTKLFVW
jgi:hypothetical protein